jgi:hypothetical protein
VKPAHRIPNKKLRQTRRAAAGDEASAPRGFSLREALKLTVEQASPDGQPEKVHLFWKILLFALPVYYFLAFGRFGFSERDDGFVLAYAWRVLNGEWPHRDFICVRPAVPAYLHALFLLLAPESIEIVFDRFMNYAMAAAANFFLFAAIDRWLPLARFHVNRFSMAAIGFIYSVHSFPPMAWTTTDGIFFCALSLYLLTRGPQFKWMFSGMLAVILGLLAKQSFILMPPAALAVVFALYGTRVVMVALASAAGISAFFAGAGALLGVLGPFLSQTTNTVGRGNVFFYSGVLTYLEHREYFYLILIFLVLRAVVSIPKIPVRVSMHVFGACVAAVSIATFYESLYNTWTYRFFTTPYHMVRSLWWLGGVFLFLLWQPLKVRASILPVFGLLLAWSVSATNGYPTPALCSGPLVFAIFYAGVNRLSRRWALVATHLLLWGGLGTYTFSNMYPYQSGPIWTCKYDMGQVFKKASFIKADKNAFDLFTELKELSAKYGPNFKTLPNIPNSNYLTNTRSPIGVDWVSDYELPGEWKPTAEQLDASGAVVFLRTSLMESELLPVLNYGGINSTVTFYVKNTWKKIESRPHFDVYKKE